MFSIGQRWYSEGEPELGLGIVEAVEGKRVNLYYPLSQEKRIYGVHSSPLKRFSLSPKDTFEDVNGKSYQVDKTEEENGVIFYLCGAVVIPEMQISPRIDLNGPMERLLLKNFDSNDFFQLRYQSYLEKRHYQSFKYKGFLSPKIRLIPHQVYVVNEVLKMDSPKVMLCDEVGLGKTIEASLILNSLIQKELVENALIIVPESLANQWFVELFKKFSLSFSIMLNYDDEIDLTETQRLIISSKILREDAQLENKIINHQWDILVIDESHQLNFQDNNTVINSLRHINQKTFSTLLLSATPEVLGVKNLYSQLNFLDDSKYNNFEDFQKTIDESKKISNIIKLTDLKTKHDQLDTYFTKEELNNFNNDHEIKQALIDRYGTGRSYFRNSRSNLENYSRLFNDRILHEYPITIKEKITDKEVLRAKTSIILDIIYKNPEKKILIICHSKQIVLKLIKKLNEIDNFKIASFHSDQTLMERDRQAAYFADEDGASILISTELGSEGRNFEFAEHLVLMDLPKLPDQLEQRIGRLDRIGQKNDINIHVPYIAHTFEDTMFQWYKIVLNAFESSPKGANYFYESHHQALKNILESAFDIEKTRQFITSSQKDYASYKTNLEEGRDLLVETHSYNDQLAKKIIKEIEDYQNNNSPIGYLDMIFNAIGINFEELNDYSYYIKPSDNMLIPSFPGLSTEGIGISSDREFALRYDHIELISWEHPILKGCFEILLNSPLGNISVVKQSEIADDVYFEFIISLQCVDEHKHEGSLYLPYTPIRVFLNAKTEDLTKKYPKKFIDSIIHKLDSGEEQILEQLPKDFVKALFESTLKIANTKSQKYKSMALDKLKNNSMHEVARIENLSIDFNEKQILLTQYKKNEALISKSITESNLSIDSIRVILPIS